MLGCRSAPASREQIQAFRGCPFSWWERSKRRAPRSGSCLEVSCHRPTVSPARKTPIGGRRPWPHSGAALACGRLGRQAHRLRWAAAALPALWACGPAWDPHRGGAPTGGRKITVLRSQTREWGRIARAAALLLAPGLIAGP